jgi:hypothetical protein
MIRECEARWQCLPEGQLSLSMHGDGSKVADVTSSYFPRSPLKCQKRKEVSRGKTNKTTKTINNPPFDMASIVVGVQH